MRPERFRLGAYGVLRRGGKVLLTESRFMGKSFVNFPGGGVELGEAPGEALVREFREETGLEARPARLLYATRELQVSTQRPWQLVSVYWELEDAGGAPRLEGNGDDVIRLFWEDPAALPHPKMFPSEVEACRAIFGEGPTSSRR